MNGRLTEKLERSRVLSFNFATSGTNTPSPDSSTTSPNQNNTNIWGIVGGAVGGGAALVIALFVVYRRKLCCHPLVKPKAFFWR
jgi:hypothetical protein